MKTNIDGGFLASDKLGSGIPILFIHGYPLSRKIWEPQVKSVSEKALVITVDLRGHGDSSEFDGAYSMDMLADDCVQVLKGEGIAGPAVICGHSMGGYISFALYRKYPELVRGLILTSTRPGADSPEGKANRDASIKTALDQGASSIADGMIQKMFSPNTYSTKPGLVKEVREIMANTSVLGIVGALQAMRDRPDSTQWLPQVQCPVLVIHGEDDQLIPFKEAEMMVEKINKSHLVKITKAGHMPSLEQPDDFTRAISEFLGGLS